jgi:hypothetical protein
VAATAATISDIHLVIFTFREIASRSTVSHPSWREVSLRAPFPCYNLYLGIFALRLWNRMLRAKSLHSIYVVPAACCKFVGILALLALGASDYGCEAFTSSVIVVSNTERLRFICSNPKQQSIARVLSFFVSQESCLLKTVKYIQKLRRMFRRRDVFRQQDVFHQQIISLLFDLFSSYPQGRNPCLRATAPDNDSKEGKDSNNENKKKPPPPKIQTPLIVPDGDLSINPVPTPSLELKVC